MIGLDTNQVAVILGVRPETVREYVRTGRLKAKKGVFGRLSILVASLTQFIQEQQSLGSVDFTKNKITLSELEKTIQAINFLVLDTALSFEGEVNQGELFRLTWLILSTKFIPEWEAVGKKYRSQLSKVRDGVRGNPIFGGLELAFQLYDLRVKKEERILA